MKLIKFIKKNKAEVFIDSSVVNVYIKGRERRLYDDEDEDASHLLREKRTIIRQKIKKVPTLLKDTQTEEVKVYSLIEHEEMKMQIIKAEQ